MHLLTLLAALGCFLVAVHLLHVLWSRQPKGTKQLPGPKGKHGRSIVFQQEIDSVSHQAYHSLAVLST